MKIYLLIFEISMVISMIFSVTTFNYSLVYFASTLLKSHIQNEPRKLKANFGKNVEFTTYWNDQEFAEYTYTVKTLFCPSNYNFIKFFSEGNKEEKKSHYTWGDEWYWSISINEALHENFLTPYLFNVGKNDPFSFSKYNYAVVAFDKKKYIGAILRIDIFVSFSFYWEKGEWYFQIHINHYGKCWGSLINGEMSTPLGSSFILSKVPLN